MKVKVGEIAEVIAGYTFRGAIEPDSNGQLFVLQAKNVSQGEAISTTDNLVKTSVSISRSASYLQSGDAVIVSRAMGVGTFRSAVFTCDNRNVIASSSVHIIRITNKDILPEYVSLYLNSSEGQNALAQIVSGSHIQTLLRKGLADILIPLPSIDKQRLVVELHVNIQQQEQILEQKKRIKRNISNAVFKNLTTI